MRKPILLPFLFLLPSLLYPREEGKCQVFLLGKQLDSVDYIVEEGRVFLALDLAPISSLVKGVKLTTLKENSKIFYPLDELKQLKALSCKWDGKEKKALIAIAVRRENITWERTNSSLVFRIIVPLPLSLETGIISSPPRAFIDIIGAHLYPAKIEEDIGDNLKMRVAQHSLAPDIVRFILDLPPSPPKVEFSSSPSQEIKLTLISPLKGKGSGLESIELMEVDGGILASLKLSQLSEYKTLLLKNPPRLAIDISPAYLSPSLMPPQKLFSPISQVRWSQFSYDPPTVRVVFELEKSIGVDIRAEPTLIKVKFGSVFRRELQKLSALKIVIDPGHGGSEPGAISKNGLQEKDINLDIAERIKKLLPTVILTREDDVNVSLQERVAFASQVNADVFISIHNNSMPQGKTGAGTETYYFREDSLLLAQCVHQALISKLGLPDGGVRRRGFYVIKNSPCPSILIEGAYLSNLSEEALLTTEEFRQKIAEAVVEGLRKYYEEGK